MSWLNHQNENETRWSNRISGWKCRTSLEFCKRIRRIFSSPPPLPPSSLKKRLLSIFSQMLKFWKKICTQNEPDYRKISNKLAKQDDQPFLIFSIFSKTLSNEGFFSTFSSTWKLSEWEEGGGRRSKILKNFNMNIAFAIFGMNGFNFQSNSVFEPKKMSFCRWGIFLRASFQFWIDWIINTKMRSDGRTEFQDQNAELLQNLARIWAGFFQF